MKKYLRVTMPDGSKWDVPAEKIAENRALYFCGDKNNRNYEVEFNASMGDDFHSEIEDWASNNMNWRDVAQFAAKVGTPIEVDFQYGWINGDKEIISR
jgi:hypothetical protein